MIWHADCSRDQEEKSAANQGAAWLSPTFIQSRWGDVALRVEEEF